MPMQRSSICDRRVSSRLPENDCGYECSTACQKSRRNLVEVIAASMLCLPAKGVHAQGQNVIGLNHCPSKDNWAGVARSDAHIEAVPLNGHEGMYGRPATDARVSLKRNSSWQGMWIMISLARFGSVQTSCAVSLPPKSCWCLR